MRFMMLRGRAVTMGLTLAVGGVAACNLITGANELTVAGGGVGGAGGDTSSTVVVGPSSTSAATTSTGNGGTTAATTTTVASTTAATTTTTSGGGPAGAAQLCVDTINMFRATRGLPPYDRWMSNESCVDMEAATDGTKMSPHYSFINQHMCSSYAENECPNWSKDPLDPGQGIVGCLTQMWGEKDQPGCAGCDTCDFPYQGCTNCTANGATVCGHYLDMKSSVLTGVACGFWSGGWYTQDFH